MAERRAKRLAQRAERLLAEEPDSGDRLRVSWSVHRDG